jgi:molecular chaperone DnaK
VGAIQQKTQALLQASMKLGEAMYKAQQEKEAASANPSDKAGGPDGKGPDAGGTGGKDEKVVDAEYEEVDEKNKKKSA